MLDAGFREMSTESDFRDRDAENQIFSGECFAWRGRHGILTQDQI